MRNKLEALKHAVQELKNGKFYDWTDVESCNCGIVAQSVLETDITGIHGMLFEAKNPISGLYSFVCHHSGERMNVVLVELFKAGFDKTDIQQLENLSSWEIRRESGHVDLQREKKEHLILYLEAWIRILEREETTKPEAVKELPAKPMTYLKHSEMEAKQALIFKN